MEFMITVISFVVALGILITIHEYGHYWVARRVGVKVLRFSVGFGKPLYKRVYGADNTEFVLAAIPLGGYVKMLDEREGEVEEADLPRSFNRQSLSARTAIVAAGPLVNLGFAVFAYWVMFMMGVVGTIPLVGDVPADSPAARAGFAIQDEIVAINGEQTPNWNSAFSSLLTGILDDGPILIDVIDQSGDSKQRSLVVDDALMQQDPADLIRLIGLRPWHPPYPARIGALLEGPGKRGGLLTGDTVLRVDGQLVDGWQAWVEIIRAHPEKALLVEVEREVDGSVTSVELEITPAAKQTDEGVIGHIGIGLGLPENFMHAYQREVHYGPLDALALATNKTWDTSVLLLKMLGRIVTGHASVKNISGPISIAQFAGQAASRGFGEFLAFLALVSISLGVMNLLPVPVLDGGHLLYYLVEFVRGGRPLSEAAQLVGQKLGLAMLLGLMSLAFYNDFARLFG